MRDLLKYYKKNKLLFALMALAFAGLFSLALLAIPQDQSATVLASGTEQTPWQSNQYGALYTELSGPCVAGYRFVPLKDGRITKLGGYFHDYKKLKLWDNTHGQLLATTGRYSNNYWAYSSVGGSEGIAVTAGNTYTVFLAPWSSSDPNCGGASQRRYISLPQTYGDIEIQTSCYSTSPGASYPNICRSHTMYGQVDIGFVPEFGPVDDLDALDTEAVPAELPPGEPIPAPPDIVAYNPPRDYIKWVWNAASGNPEFYNVYLSIDYGEYIIDLLQNNSS